MKDMINTTKARVSHDRIVNSNLSKGRRHNKYKYSPNVGQNFYGAIDLGTNNCRLLVAQPSGGGFQVLDSFSRIVRLGEGLLTDNYLKKSAMDRTIFALKICSQKLNSFDVMKSRNIATEACRRAENCDAFFDKIDQETGLRFETITSNEEARLALLGCQILLNPKKPYAIVFDIGGGSTEIIWAQKSKKNYFILDVLSIPAGVVTLSEKSNNREVDYGLYNEMVNSIFRQLFVFSKRNNIEQRIIEKKVQMLGTSGTVTTLGAVHLNLNRYDRSMIDGLDLTFDNLKQARDKLINRNYQERTRIPCIGSERVNLIVPGCAILEAICQKWKIGNLQIADRGLREGMLLESMMKDGLSITGNPAANSLNK